MTTTLTYDATTVTPLNVDGWSQTRDSGTLRHDYIDGSVDYTIRAMGPRTGTLSLLFTSEAEALSCEALHQTAPYIDIVSDERDIANGRYVVADGGAVGVELDDETRDLWVVTVDFSEVLA